MAFHTYLPFKRRQQQSQCIRCVDALIFYLISWHIISLHTAKSLLILDGLSFSWLHCVTEMLQVKFRGKEERKKEKRDHKTCRPVGQTLRHTHPTRKQSNFGQSYDCQILVLFEVLQSDSVICMVICF